MKNIILTVLILFSVIANINAQKSSLTITVNSIKKDSFPDATIQIFHLPDSSLIHTAVAKAADNKINVNNFSKYFIKVSAIGFETIEKTVSVTDKPVLTSVALKKMTTTLNSVVVTSKRPLIKQEDDKTIVDAEVLANSSSNAYEVLEKTPGAVVDQDGNIYLTSLTPATIQINGREMKLSAADISSLLKSLPAGSISKIEILRNPSAKYDAASSGGIVNIVLKKGVKLGSSGSMNINSFQGIYNTRSAGFNLNINSGKVTSYLSYQATERNNFEDINSKRFLSASNAIISQNSGTFYPSSNQYIGAGTDIGISKKFNITYDVRLSVNDGRSKAQNLIDIIDIGSQSVSGKNESKISNHNNSVYVGNNLFSKLKMDTLGSEWTVQLDYNHYHSSNEQLYNNYYTLPFNPTLFGNGNSSNNKNVLVVQTDLVKKMKHKFTVEAGFKSTMSNSRNSADYFYQKGSSGIVPDKFQTNTFTYKETITAAYVQISKKIAGFTIKPGIRMEGTNINGRQIIPTDTLLSIKRTDFFPYLFVQHKLFKIFGFPLTGNAIIRRSISRPYYEILNPYPKYVDQYLFDVGNPRLQPQFTNNYELNATYNEIPVLAVGINDTKNIFSNVTYQDDATGIAYRTYDNLGSNKEYYARIVGGIPPGGKYFFYLGGQYNYNQFKGFYQNRPFTYERGAWLFFMYQNWKVRPDITLSTHGYLRLKGLQNFYELNSFGALNFSINKSILNKKANLILAFNDIFRTNNTSFAIQQGNVTAFGTRVGDTRKVGLTFRYNFGIKPKEENKSMFGQPAEN